jgi:hypothetical protein
VKLGRTTQDHVLADGGDQVGQHVRHDFAVGGLAGVDGVDAVVVQADGRDLADGVLEQLVAAQEVGLGVHFDSGGGHAGAVVADGDAHEAFGGDAVGLLGGLGQALGAQPVDGRVDVAAFSCRAFLQSIMPTPDFSRSSFTSAAVTSAMKSSIFKWLATGLRRG